MSAANALAEFAAWIEPVAGGWRYPQESVGYIIWDVVWGVLGITTSLAVIYFLISFGWRAAT